MLGTLIKTDIVEVADRQYAVRFYQTLTSHGSNRYSAEVALGPEDCVILDDDSLNGLEARLSNLVTASVHSRRLVTKGREAA